MPWKSVTGVALHPLLLRSQALHLFNLPCEESENNYSEFGSGGIVAMPGEVRRSTFHDSTLILRKGGKSSALHELKAKEAVFLLYIKRQCFWDVLV